MRAIVGQEVGNAIHFNEFPWPNDLRRSRGTRINIFDHTCSGRASIAFPQLLSMNTVVGEKKQGAINGGERTAIRPPSSRIDIFHQDRSCRRAIALPQLISGGSVVVDKI